MSGPKSYSAEVVDKHLKVFFMLMGEIETLWDILSQKAINDTKHQISVEGSQMCQALQPLYDEIANPTFNQSGQVLTQAEFDAFYNQIISTTGKQKLLLQKLNGHLSDFEVMEEAYARYLELDALLQKYKEDFGILKEQLLLNCQAGLQQGSAADETIRHIKQSEFAYQLPHFDINLAQQIEKESTAIQKAFEASRSTLIKVSQGVKIKHSGDSHSQKVKLVTTRTPEPETSFNERQKDLIEKITAELALLNEKNFSPKLTKRLEKLKNEKTDNRDFLLAELYEEVKASNRQLEHRQTLKKTESRLQKKKVLPPLAADLSHLQQMVKKILHKDWIKSSDVATVKEFEAALNKKEVTLQKSLAQKNAEQNFIKSRLIAALQEMNFEVVDDAEVIDLEQTGSWLLRVPGQKNYINLRFDDTGRMLYNFLIPESKNDLSIDDKNLKLAEMEEACNEFKNMLTELQQQGLQVDLKNEIDITEKALISFPAHLQTKIDNQKQATAKSRKPGAAKFRRKPRE